MLSSLKPGDAVRIRPTEGCYQKDRAGVVVRKTATLLVVQPNDKMPEERYRLSDGSPYDKINQGFPCWQAARVKE